MAIRSARRRAAHVLTALLLTSAGLVSAPAAAQRPATPARGPAAELVRAEGRLLEAMTARDSARLARLLAPGFALVSAYSEGESIPRLQWIRGVLDRRSTDVGVLEASDVRLHAPTVATVTARIRWTVQYAGEAPVVERYLVTDTWIRRGTTWLLAARHSSTRREGTSP